MLLLQCTVVVAVCLSAFRVVAVRCAVVHCAARRRRTAFEMRHHLIWSVIAPPRGSSRATDCMAQGRLSQPFREGSRVYRGGRRRSGVVWPAHNLLS